MPVRPQLDGFTGRVSDSGEGRWTVLAAVDEGVPATVITTSLYERFESRRLGEFTDKVMSAMRSRVRRARRKKGLTAVHHDLEVVADPEALASTAAAFVARLARAGVQAHGRFTFAVSGGVRR